MTCLPQRAVCARGALRHLLRHAQGPCGHARIGHVGGRPYGLPQPPPQWHGLPGGCLLIQSEAQEKPPHSTQRFGRLAPPAQRLSLPTVQACYSPALFTILRSCSSHGWATTTGPDATQAKCLHCVRTACILRTQRLGYSPKNTCHLFTRGKTERCQYHRVGQVSIDTAGCSYNQQHRRRRTVRSWCRLATIEYRRSRAFKRR